MGEAVSDELHEDKAVGLVKKIVPGADVDDILDDIGTGSEEEGEAE